MLRRTAGIVAAVGRLSYRGPARSDRHSRYRRRGPSCYCGADGDHSPDGDRNAGADGDLRSCGDANPRADRSPGIGTHRSAAAHAPGRRYERTGRRRL